jgi:hypothetical protein
MSSNTSPVSDRVVTRTVPYGGRLLRYATLDGTVWWAVPDVGAALALSRADGSLTYRLGKLALHERRLLPLATGCGVRKVGAVSHDAVMRLATSMGSRTARKFHAWLAETALVPTSTATTIAEEIK